MPKTIGRLPAAAAPPDVESTLTKLDQFWTDYGYKLVLAAMIAVALFMFVSLILARRKGRVDRWMANLAAFTVLALSAEGMWEVARETLHLPALFAAGVFFVAELAMLSQSISARRHYEMTTVRDKDGKISTPGHPGKFGTAVWVIAIGAGFIVAFNATTFVEFLFRLALPLVASYMWWNALTAEGTSRPQGVWRWTPRKVLAYIGAIEPTAQTAEKIDRERLVKQMTKAARIRDTAPEGRKRSRAIDRLERLALRADDDIVAEVHGRIARAAGIHHSTSPGLPVGLNDRLDTFRTDFTAEMEQAVQAAVQPLLQAAEQAVQAAERTTSEHRGTLHRMEEVHAEQLASARRSTAPVQQWSANGRTASAEPVQRTSAPAPVRPSTPAPARTAAAVQEPAPVVMTDEEAVQAMLKVTADPRHQWVKRDVRTLTGAGFPRIDKLIAQWAERAAALAAVQDQSTTAGAAVQEPGAEPVQVAGAAAEQPVQLTGAGPVQETGAPTNGAAHLVAVGEPEPVVEVSAGVR